MTSSLLNISIKVKCVIGYVVYKYHKCTFYELDDAKIVLLTQMSRESFQQKETTLEILRPQGWKVKPLRLPYFSHCRIPDGFALRHAASSLGFFTGTRREPASFSPLGGCSFLNKTRELSGLWVLLPVIHSSA